MKVHVQQIKPPEVFNPVKLTIEFTSKDELDRFATIFNMVRINGFLGGNYIYDALSSTTTIVDRNRYYDELAKSLRGL